MKKILLAVMMIVMMITGVRADPVPGAQPRTINGMSPGTIQGTEQRISSPTYPANNIDFNDSSTATTFGSGINVVGTIKKNGSDYINYMLTAAAGIPIDMSSAYIFGYLTPYTNETELMQGTAMTYEGATWGYSAFATKGTIRTANTTNATDYLCTGTDSTCANNAVFSFVESPASSQISIYTCTAASDTVTADDYKNTYGWGTCQRFIHNGDADCNLIHGETYYAKSTGANTFTVYTTADCSTTQVTDISDDSSVTDVLGGIQMNGFAGWRWIKFKSDGANAYSYFQKWTSTNDREWKFSQAITGNGYATFQIRDNGNGVGASTCGISATAYEALSPAWADTEWHMVGFIYDGRGGINADAGMAIYGDGVDISAALAGCANYAWMSAATKSTIGTAPLAIYSNFESGPSFIVPLPAGATITPAQWLAIYNAQRPYVGF